MTEAAAIEAVGLRKRYGDTVAVDGVDLRVERGEIFGLLGPNGAGKTTTLEMIEGLRKPDEGDVSVAGYSVRRQPQQVKERIGILLQQSQMLPHLTARELLELYASFYPKSLKPDDLIEQLQLTEKVKTRVEKLSGGQRQRVALGVALVGDPEIVFLDEPTTGLDPQARTNFWDVIKSMTGRTIVLSTHYMEEAEALCDRVAIMDHGSIIDCGPPRELIRRHTEGSVIEVTADGELTYDGLRDVTQVRSENGTCLLYTTSLPSTIADLLDRARNVGATLSDLRARSGTLNDVFLNLTGRSLRE